MTRRLFGVSVSDINCRVLITELTADGTPHALETAERISRRLGDHEESVALTPPMRDAILRCTPKPPPSGLVALRDALTSDHRARA